MSRSSKTKPSVEKITILVVDDDSTCLAIVAAILKTWKYEVSVVTVKHAADALCTLRIKGDSFDLVVTDVHMPDMNGFELQKQIDEEFNLPVVLMSADDKEGVILKGLENGAAFFLVKPISPDDLKNLWQYAVANKKGKAAIKKIRSVQGTSGFDHDKASNEDIYSASSVNEDSHDKKDSRKKVPRKYSDEKGGDQENDDSAAPKKAKVVWTNALHNQFLEAIRSIGLERAVPKKILEHMNVPGLTRENIASHLQKYRIFLKQVSDASYNIQSAAERRLADRTLEPSFVPGQPWLKRNKLGQGYLLYPEHQQMRTPFQQRFTKHVPVVKASDIGHLSFPNKEASSSNFIPPPRYGQSRLLCDKVTNLEQPVIGNEDLYQPNCSSLTMEPNDFRRGSSLCGGISIGLMNGTNSMRHPKSLPESFNGLSKYNPTTFGVLGPNNVTDCGQMRNLSNSNLNPIPKYSNNNYAGYRIARDGQLVGSAHMANLSDGASKGSITNYSLMNGIQNGNVTNVSDNTTGYLLQEMSSSSGIKCSNRFSPTLTDAIDPQENVLVPEMPPTMLQQNIPANEGVNDDYIAGLMNNSSTTLDNFLSHVEADFSSTFLNLQQGGEEITNSSFTFGTHDIEDNPLLGNHRALEQQFVGGEDLDSSFSIDGYQSNEYFPWLDQNPKQQQGLEELVDYEDHGNYQSYNTVLWNNVSPRQLDDEIFIQSMFSPDAFGGSDNLGGF
ncbi:putative two-component response regulator ARR21 [Cornus florida]|uniref:putative two-component response regulator ARR21 n=1 Tax=Cornus florida TaxID=4283 RepID=UPI0028A066EA|nr:putative two-component response regulator ARR21 [Cornus florida]